MDKTVDILRILEKTASKLADKNNLAERDLGAMAKELSRAVENYREFGFSLSYKDLTLCEVGQIIIHKKKKVKLTLNEFSIVRELFLKCDQETIIPELWQYRSFDTHWCNLRKKVPVLNQYFKSTHGEGIQPL